MANIKKVIAFWNTGKTLYVDGLVREADGYILDDTDGTFAASPADKILSLTEHPTIKGRYELSESRQSWNNGKYTAPIKEQAGASPADSDYVVGAWQTYINSDTEILLDKSVAGLNDLAQSDILNDDTPFAGANIANLDAAISSLNNISVADILAGVVEGTLTVQDVMRLLLAWVGGERTYADNGDGTYTITFSDNADSKPRITITTDENGASILVTLDAS